MRAGAAVSDITPQRGYLAGFAARTEPAAGTHDPITVRALAVDDTALVTLDVCGLDEQTCGAIRSAAPLAARRVLVHATHTHGGPACMPGRLEKRVDADWLARTVHTAVDTIRTALASQVEVTLTLGTATDPGIAKNRRHLNGPVDRIIPVVALDSPDGRVATVVSHACHAVVLGPDNRYFTADFPGVVRDLIEQDHPGSVCLFLTGCAGDVNTGHSAYASMKGAASPRRTFEEAQRIGGVISGAVAQATLSPSSTDSVWCLEVPVSLAMSTPTPDGLAQEMARFTDLERAAEDDGERALYRSWLEWARETSPDPGSDEWHGSVSLLAWGDLRLAALPGEPFAIVAAAVRDAIGHPNAMVIGYTNGCPGYLPTVDEYEAGGYEVADAHRYYGQPGPFAPGSAEALVTAVSNLARSPR